MNVIVMRLVALPCMCRTSAVTGLANAIDSYLIRGPRHNLSFIRAVLSNDKYVCATTRDTQTHTRATYLAPVNTLISHFLLFLSLPHNSTVSIMSTRFTPIHRKNVPAFRFISGSYSTAFIKEEFPDGFHSHNLLNLPRRLQYVATACAVHYLRYFSI